MLLGALSGQRAAPWPHMPGNAVQMVRQVRAGAPASGFFDADIVGPSGAGFNYSAETGTATPAVDILTSIALPPVALARERVALLAAAPSGTHDEEAADRGADGDGDADVDPELVFKREVQDTLLRTMALAQESDKARGSMTDNAVIELNGLKIAGAHLRCLDHLPSCQQTGIDAIQRFPIVNVSRASSHLCTF